MGAVSNKKSLFLTYIYWFFGGIFGLHHFYLERDAQAFIWWCTLGGYLGFGWLRDAFTIPRYVAEYNEEPAVVEKHLLKMKANIVPPFSMQRFIGMVVVGYLFSSLVLNSIPDESVFGIDLKFLNVLVPLSCAVGVWTVGNIGKERGTIWWSIAAAYAAYPFCWYIEDESTWFTLMVFGTALSFDNMSKQWRKTPRRKRSVVKRVSTLAACGVLYLAVWSSYLYFNGKITDSEGEEIPIQDAVHHFFTSPWWVDIHQALYDTWVFAQHHGWYEIWKQIVDLSDPHGEMNAYKVLNVSSSSSQAEITSNWRTLSREFHPDKVKDPELKTQAQARFMEIQQAYELLSNRKAKRKSKNKISSKE